MYNLIAETDFNTVDFDKFEKEKEKYILERQKNIAKYIKEKFYFGEMLII